MSKDEHSTDAAYKRLYQDPATVEALSKTIEELLTRIAKLERRIERIEPQQNYMLPEEDA